jgi:hypothetical protein
MRDRHDPNRQERHRKRMERHAATATAKRPKTKKQLRGIVAQAKRMISKER